MVEALFLVSLLKGIEIYRKPLFWATLYVLFLWGSDYMFQLAFSHHPGWLARQTVMNFALSYAYFYLLKETQDGLPYWVTFCLGFLLLIFVVP